MKAPELLEATLRDGSYAINFQFGIRETKEIARGLEEAGAGLIEIGHGVGLGASTSGHGEAAATDEEYLAAAAEVLTTAKFGMFCIPGIATLDDVDLCARYGAEFIRIGTNVTEIERSQPFIERAKHHGMTVSANFMKSYVLPPKDFAEKAELSRSYGTDIVCIVDSAGGMVREELAEYVHAVRESCDAAIGFHGHNNLGIAVANTIEMVKLGADVVDVTLQGMGRGAGNASTEMVVLLLKKAGYEVPLDEFKLMDLAIEYIRPLIHKCLGDSIDLVSGMAMFHSSYMGVIRRYADKYGVDPRYLILRVCEFDRVNAPDELVERCAKELHAKGVVPTTRFQLHDYYGHEQLPS